MLIVWLIRYLRVLKSRNPMNSSTVSSRSIKFLMAWSKFSDVDIANHVFTGIPCCKSLTNVTDPDRLTQKIELAIWVRPNQMMSPSMFSAAQLMIPIQEWQF